ncbi:DUF1161 domain-containing protein [Piscinibacter sp.]|uniref:DUF1161 domain-containing protein n=1 Tax=Piscinibacter sp. TaxID=1903157 RepID=UPI0039E5438A
MTHLFARLALALAAVAPAAALAQAGNCDEIRARIEAKMRAAGVAEPRLLVAEKDAKAAGKVVGSCDLGRRQIVQLPHGASAPRGGDAILTECKDGTVKLGGDCRP